MIEFGKTLKSAREAKGLSVSQLAELTRMPVARIEQLEAEDFSKIPAPIYGRGFVRLYCEAVGIDSKPLADEFTDIYNGKREPEIKERAPAPASPAPVAAPDASAGFQLASETIAAPEPIIAPEPIVVPEPVTAPEPPPAASPSLSRYAAPVHEPASFSLPPSVWRFAVLGVVAVIVLWLAFLGVRALYRATAPRTPTPAPRTAHQAPSTAHPAPRTPQKIPELYID